MLVYPVKHLPRGESTSPSYITTQIVKERIPTDLVQGTNGSGKCHCRLSPGGARRDRTADPLLAKQVLSQLSYSPLIELGCQGFNLGIILQAGGSGKI